MPPKPQKKAGKPKAQAPQARKPRLAPGQSVLVRDYQSPAGHPKLSTIAYRAASGKNVFSSDANAYAAATFFPFSDAAVGARVPEPYAVRTRTTKVTTPFRVAPTNGGFDAIITPNVLNTITSNLGTWSGGAPTQFLAVGSSTAGISGQFPQNMLACTTQANLAAAYTTYRVVGMGVRIKCDSSFTNTQGRLFVAVVPSMPSAFSFLDSGATISDVYSALGAPTDTTQATGGFAGAVNSQIVSYPLSEEFAITQLMENGGAEIMFPRTSSRATDFLVGDLYTQNAGSGWQGFALQSDVGVGMTGGTQYQGNSTTVLSNAQAKTAVHVINNNIVTDYDNLSRCGVDPTLYSTAGMSTLLMRADGLASTTVLTVEVIFHLEGQTSIGSQGGASTVLIDDSMSRAIAPRTVSESINMAACAAHPIVVGLKECGRAVMPAIKSYIATGRAGAISKGVAGIMGLLA